MNYLNRYFLLKDLFKKTININKVEIDDYEIHKINFNSNNSINLPDYAFSDNLHPYNLNDQRINENNSFFYLLFKQGKFDQSRNVIILFHGLNERFWDKYLVWAEKLMYENNTAVVLFPIAFHMNRAPASWCDPRQIAPVYKKRSEQNPDLVASSIANTSISIRIEEYPERFFCSGFETYLDVMQLIHQIRENQHPLIHPLSKINFFGYSAGALLTEILMLTNPDQLFDESKALLFCGGSLLSRCNPLSKYILDSHATEKFRDYYLDHFENYLAENDWFHDTLNHAGLAGKYFCSMLKDEQEQKLREESLKRLSGQIKGIALKKDEVFNYQEIKHTLNGLKKDIPIEISIFDYNFPYSHISPFPYHKDYEEKINFAFQEIFSEAIAFFKT